MHASKVQDGWSFVPTDRRPMGPFSQLGLFVVTRQGVLILHFVRPDGRWATARADSTSVISTGHLLTHAAIAPTEGMLDLLSF
jgi:hypothetical protein